MERTDEQIAETITVISQDQVHRCTAEQILRDHGDGAQDAEAELGPHMQSLALLRFRDCVEAEWTQLCQVAAVQQNWQGPL